MHANLFKLIKTVGFVDKSNENRYILTEMLIVLGLIHQC